MLLQNLHHHKILIGRYLYYTTFEEIKDFFRKRFQYIF